VSFTDNLTWYFNRGWWTFISLPYFLLLIYVFSYSLQDVFIWSIAYWQVLFSVFGFLLALLGICVGLWLASIPTIIYVGMFLLTPQKTKDTSEWGLVFFAVSGFLLGWVFYKINPFMIGFIADQGPCAAWQLGITDSIPSTGC